MEEEPKNPSPLEEQHQAATELWGDLEKLVEKHQSKIKPQMFVVCVSMFASRVAYFLSPDDEEAYEVLMKGISAGKDSVRRTKEKTE